MSEAEIEARFLDNITKWQNHLEIQDWNFDVVVFNRNRGRNSYLDIDCDSKKVIFNVIDKWESEDRIKQVINYHMFGLMCRISKIESDRLYLRHIELSDASVEWQIQKDPRVTLFDGYAPITDRVKFIQKLTYMSIDNCTFGIVIKGQKEIIGHVSIRPNFRYDNAAEIGYAIHPDYWNKGYATEVCSALIEFCFNELKVDTVVASHFESNDASSRVMDKVGMEFIEVITKGFEHEVYGKIDLYVHCISRKKYYEETAIL